MQTWKDLTDTEVRALREELVRDLTSSTDEILTRYDISRTTADKLVCGMYRREAGGPMFAEGVRRARREMVRFSPPEAPAPVPVVAPPTFSRLSEKQQESIRTRFLQKMMKLPAIALLERLEVQEVADALGLGKVSASGRLLSSEALHLVPTALRDSMTPRVGKVRLRKAAKRCPTCGDVVDNPKRHKKFHENLRWLGLNSRVKKS